MNALAIPRPGPPSTAGPLLGGRTYVTACRITSRRLIEIPSDEDTDG